MRSVHLVFLGIVTLYTGWNLPDFGLGEWLALSIFLSIYFGARFIFRKDLTGMLLIGVVPGATLEWITEAYWNYRLEVYLWKDISFYVLLGWAYNFTFLVLISDFVHRKLFPGGGSAPQPSQLACDGVIGTAFFIVNEFIGIRLLGLWEYADCAGWVLRVPGLDYPLEGIIGAGFLSLSFPTLIRHWETRMQLFPNRP